MKVKFLRTIITFFGTFYADSVHDLTQEQADQLLLLNPNEIELMQDAD